MTTERDQVIGLVRRVEPDVLLLGFARALRAAGLAVTADRERTFLLTGTGDVIEPEGGVIAIGSGGPYALAAARALVDATSLSAREITERALKIAGEICIYTNQNRTIEVL